MCRELETVSNPPTREVSNRDEHFFYTPELIFEPTNVADISDIVRCAELQQPPRRVQACGSRWSLNRTHQGEDYLILPDQLRDQLGIVTRGGGGLEIPLATHALDENGGAFGFIHCESGCLFRDLYIRADQEGAAIPTQGGGAGGTTVAGITSTGTHGSDINLPPLADYIRAIHLVGSGGQEYWIERAEPNNISDPDRLWPDDRKLIYDDEVFFATIVSLGRFGVIYSLVYEILPNYVMREQRGPFEWPQIRDDFIRALDPQGLFRSFSCFNDHLGGENLNETLPRFFQIDLSFGTFNDPSQGDSRCYVTRRCEVQDVDPADYRPKDRFIVDDNDNVDPNDVIELITQNSDLVIDVIQGIGNGADLLIDAGIDVSGLGNLWDMVINGGIERFINSIDTLVQQDRFIEVLYDLAPELINRMDDVLRRRLNDWLISEVIEPHPGGFGLNEAAIIDGGLREPIPFPRGDSLEYAFDARDANRYTDLVDFVLDAAKSPQLFGWISLRYTKGTSALIGMQQFEDTVSVEISFLQGVNGNVAFLDNVRRRARELGGIPHWAQMHDFQNRAEIEGYYGANINVWLRALRQLTKRGRASTFENDFTASLGLTVLNRSNNLLLFS